MRWKGLICLALALAVVGAGCKRRRPATSARSSVPWQIRTALHTAVRNSDVNAVRSLIAAGADVNTKGYSAFRDKDEVTPLHVCGNRDIAALLIDSGANVNAKDGEGYTPLHMAAQYHAHEMARVLIEKGADVNAKDRREESPLYAPVATGDRRMVQLLIDAGADVRIRNWQGQSLLHTAIQDSDSGTSSNIFALLIAAGTDVNAATPSGCTPLHYAARDGYVRAAELLLAHGADANAKTSSGQTPLHLAARRGYSEIVTLFVDKGANTDVKDRDGKTPLDYACAAKWEKVVALLTGGKITEEEGIEAEESQADAIGQSESQRGAQTDVERLVSGNCAFALDLYRALNAKEGNLFFSPYSISTALAMTYAGAFENTAMEMADTLHFSMDPRRLHFTFAKLQAKMNRVQEGGNIALHVANSLWPQEGHPFLREYLSLIEKHYGVSITAVDYRTDGTREAARQMINQWVEKRTEDKIKEPILPGRLTDATRLVLTNAIYFKGKWKDEFDPKDTKEAAFFLSAAKSISVPTMYQDEVFGYAETPSLQILEMPYRGGELSMLVLLPRRIEGIKQLEHSLTVDALQGWRACLKQQKVIVFLPKFRTTFRVELKETLQSMGMVDAFQWPGANFAGFDGDSRWFCIGEVIHKAYVDVNEEGTEAAAATAVDVLMRGMPPQPPVFRADHPFLFLIQENSTGSILFLGRVADPTQAG